MMAMHLCGVTRNLRIGVELEFGERFESVCLDVFM